MDLNCDLLHHEEEMQLIALSHLYRSNGDSVPDPDMQIRIWSSGMAEALTYQDTYRYQEVYDLDGMHDQKVRGSLNAFLNQWLTNLLQQGHFLK